MFRISTLILKIILVFLIILLFNKKGRSRFRISKRFIITVLISLAFIFGWAIWTVFLQDVVPRHRTFFVSYDSFCKKAEHASFISDLPESSKDIKYYWGIDWFVEIAGYGTSLSDEDYEKLRAQALEDYRKRSLDGNFPEKTLYLYTNGEEREYVNDEWLKKYDVSKANELLADDEEIKDYYILAYDYTDNGRSVYFQCMLCNDLSKRIIEIDYRDMNAHPGGR